MSLIVALYAIRVRFLHSGPCHFINRFHPSAISEVGSKRQVYLWLAPGRDPCRLGEWCFPPCPLLLGVIGSPGTLLLSAR